MKKIILMPSVFQKIGMVIFTIFLLIGLIQSICGNLWINETVVLCLILAGAFLFIFSKDSKVGDDAKFKLLSQSVLINVFVQIFILLFLDTLQTGTMFIFLFITSFYIVYAILYAIARIKG